MAGTAADLRVLVQSCSESSRWVGPQRGKLYQVLGDKTNAELLPPASVRIPEDVPDVLITGHDYLLKSRGLYS